MRVDSLLRLLLVVLATLSAGEARARFSEGTDYPGPWLSGSSWLGSGVTLDLWKDTSSGLDGIDSVAGQLSNGTVDLSWIQTNVTGPGTLYFSYRVEGLKARNGADFELLVNNSSPVLLQRIESSAANLTTGWKELAIPIGEGSSTVRWRLSASGGNLDGYVFVDQVWTSGDPRPRITSGSSFSLSGVVGDPLLWPFAVQSASAFTLRASDLPPGLSLSADGRSIVGTPTHAGTFLSKLSADNAAGTHVAEVSFSIHPDPSASIPEGLDWPQQQFTQGEAAVWTGLNGFGYSGNDCVRGETHNWNTQNIAGAGLSTAVDGPGTLSFWYYCEGQFPTNGAGIMYFAGPPTSPATPVDVFYQGGKWTKASISIPVGRRVVTLVPYRQLTNPGGPEPPDPVYVYVDGMTFESSAAEIAVNAGAAGTEVSNGDSQSFGNVAVGGGGTLDFTIRSVLSSSLTGLGTTLSGPDAGSFSLVTAPVAPVQGPDGTTTFSVRFAPVRIGAHTATLSILSNDLDENPFKIGLIGYGSVITAPPVSRVVAEGGAAAFSVAAGVPGATYQWRKDGRDIGGAVGPSLEIGSAKPWQIGEYSVVVTSAAGTEVSAPASLRLEGVPEGMWRGLVSYYPFDGHVADVLRSGLSAELVNGANVIADAERGGVASMNGKGFMVPPLPSEDPASQGPGGFIRIPRPVDGNGESFTMSLWVKERGYSSWHGESFLTLGEGAAAPGLMGHYWIGGSGGQIDHYGSLGSVIVDNTPTSAASVSADGTAVMLEPEWTQWTMVGAGATTALYRDGEFVGSAGYPAEAPGDVFLGRHWWMDAAILRYSTRFRGEVDDLRFYSRALTADEVRQLHAGTRPAPAPTAYDAWAQTHGVMGSNAGLGEDPEGDGWLMIDEYLFGTDPMRPTAEVARLGTAGMNGQFEWLGRPEADYTVAASGDLREWRPLGVAVVAAADQTGVPPGYERLQAQFPLPTAHGPLSLEALRIEGVIAPFLANGGRLDTQPAAGEALVGSEVVLGPAAGLPWETYQWLKNGAPVPGATEPTLRLPSAQPDHSGLYQLVVSNGLGSAQSRETHLRVSAPSLATVRTVSDSSAGAGQVTVQGLVEADGGLPVLERGVVFGYAANPTIENGIRIPAGNGLGFFQATAFGVAPGAPLHARAYARTTQGVAYGENRNVTLPGG